MSASREKQNRKDLTASGQIAPKTAREAQQRKEERRSNLLYGLIAVVFALVVVVSLIWNSNIISRSATAVTVDGQKYNAAQVSFYYRNAYLSFVNQWSYALGYFGLNTSQPLDGQTISDTAASFMDLELSEDEEMTWKDYFLSEALEQIATVQNGLKRASEENFAFPESVQEDFQSGMDSLMTAARSTGVSVRRYLQGTFGAVMSEGVYKAELLRLMRYDAYASAYQDSLTYTDEEIETAYTENTRDYDYVSYEAVSVNGALETEQDEEGNDIPAAEGAAEAAKTAAKNAADALAAGVRDGGTLSALSVGMDNVSPFSSDKDSYENCTYTSDEFADWLFDDARKAGDVTVIENGDLFYVVQFNDRFRDETKTVDVRHILIRPAVGELQEGDEGYEHQQEVLLEAAKTRAEEIYQQWQDGERTEESFIALVEEYSSDTGSSEDSGGLYERVSEGDMVTEFNDWCFDPARQPGDTDIIQTTYGYHIMYYVGDNPMVRWQVQVSDKLKSDAYEAWTEALRADADIQRQESGMKYVG